MGVQVAPPQTKNTTTRTNNNSDVDIDSDGAGHDAVPSEAMLNDLFHAAMNRAGERGTQMTGDEQQRFLSAMQKPEFRSLLNDYMKEISDPANRAETEQYLAQLEGENKVPDDKQLITPVPGFVIKTKWDGHGAKDDQKKKLFVNICSHERVQPPSSTRVAATASTKGGTSWQLPYSLGPDRLEKDKSGAMVTTFDVCYNTRTLEFAQMQRPFLDMVVNTALEAVEQVLRKSLDRPKGVVARDFHVLRGVLYKSGQPVTMCVRKDPAQQQKPTKGASPRKSDTQKANAAPVTASPSKKFAVKKDTTVNKEDGAVETMQKMDSTRGDKEDVPSGPKTMTYKVVYRGKFEMMDHLMETPSETVQAASRPRELVVEIDFPTRKNAAGLELDVNEKSLKLRAEGYAPLDLSLPYPVNEDTGSAKFDKKARKLVVTLPVLPPPLPARTIQVEEVEDNQTHEDQQLHEDNGVIADLPTATIPDISRAIQEKSEEAPVPSTAAAPAPAPLVQDDQFRMLRETALMVGNDPYYQREIPIPEKSTAFTSPADQTKLTTAEKVQPAPATEEEDELVRKMKENMRDHGIQFDDLPPLESCSEDEFDDALDDAVTEDVTASSELSTLEEEPKAGPTFSTPSFSITETASCLSYIISVAKILSSTIQVNFQPTQFSVTFSTSAFEAYRLEVSDLPIAVDPAKCEYDVASENMVVILHKAANSASNSNANAVTSTPEHASEPPLPTPVPGEVVPQVQTFLNDLLYELD
ncbi:TPA: hypothetical protein N0F65_005733 [Lagenidium giganteum]|uniref:Protein kintoun n=1 Tax=Lagenidium giganteum TaxID=4803 RepID=A0AAV2ZFK6_9STRA|nr:TPA: hypothetical protein N0F65_005733 [Lagenidium giganteum]